MVVSKNSAEPIALGIHWAHDASVSLCSTDRILFSIAEERLTRIKHHYGFPCESIQAAVKFCREHHLRITHVAFTSELIFYPWRKNNFRVSATGVLDGPSALGSSGAGQAQPQYDHLLKREVGRWGEFAQRSYALQQEFLTKMGLWDEGIAYYYIHHHRAHASAAYRTSEHRKACVFTADGKGDGLSATIYRGSDDFSLTLIRSSRAEDSLGAFYQAVTEALGFIPVDGEYKTMGLAAFGSHADVTKNPFHGIVKVKDGVFRSSKTWSYRSFNETCPDKKVNNPLKSVTQSEEFKQHLQYFSPEELAFYAQKHFEHNLIAYAADAIRITGEKNLTAGGGVMLNVKANGRIRDELKPSSFHIFPDATDSGLSTGAALEALYQSGALKRPIVFKEPYLGTRFTQKEIEVVLKDYVGTHEVVVSDYSPITVAKKLASGKVIGTFQGRLEIGPRALGNRSVLADPRSLAIKDKINLLLKGREPFVPFAPVVLDEDAPLYWEGDHSYRYMTFSVKAQPLACEQAPAIVHVDGSMRPQVVSKDNQPWLYEVLKAFKQLTGVGALINTSFNRHGHPIVGSPNDAFQHLHHRWVDAVVLGNTFIENIQKPKILLITPYSFPQPQHEFLGSTKDIYCRLEYFKERDIAYDLLSPASRNDEALLPELKNRHLGDYQAVIIEKADYPESMAYLKKQYPNLKLILRAHNAELYHHLHHLISRIHGNWHEGMPIYFKENFNDLRMALAWFGNDYACARLADAVISISDWEKVNYWDLLVTSEKVYYAPFFLPERFGSFSGIKKKNKCVCYMSNGITPMLADSGRQFSEWVDGLPSSDSKAWEFIITGDVKKMPFKLSNKVQGVGLLEDPFLILEDAKCIVILSDFGFGFKTKILDAISRQCWSIVTPGLFKYLPECLRPFCIPLESMTPESFLRALKRTQEALPRADINSQLRQTAFAALDCILGFEKCASSEVTLPASVLKNKNFEVRPLIHRTLGEVQKSFTFALNPKDMDGQQGAKINAVEDKSIRMAKKAFKKLFGVLVSAPKKSTK